MVLIAQTVRTLISKYIKDNLLGDNEDLLNMQKKINRICLKWTNDHQVQYIINSHPLNLYKGSEALLNTSQHIDEKWKKSNLSNNLIEPELESSYIFKNH